MLKHNPFHRVNKSLVLILALGFLLRIALAATTIGYHYDYNCFSAWGLRVADIGMADFYATDYFCDYPPGYLYILGVVGWFSNFFELHYMDAAAQVLMVLFPALCDVGLGVLLYYMAHRYGKPSIGLTLAAFVAFCPMFWYDTAVWKQMDSVLALLALGCFYCLAQNKYLLAAFLYGLSLSMKPQALMLGPVLGLCFLIPVFFAKDSKAFWRAMCNGVLGVLLALAPVYLCGVPFFGVVEAVPRLYEIYETIFSSYPYASVNAFNCMAALGGNWVAQESSFTLSLFGNSFVMPFSWGSVGTIGILLCSVFLLVITLRSYRLSQKNASMQSLFSPVFLAGVYMVLLFTFAQRMHERYLLFGIALVLGAAAQYGSKRLISLSAGLSLTTLLNMAVIYTLVQTDDEFLTSATSQLVMHVVSVAEVVFCLMLAYEAWQICSGKRHAATEQASLAASKVPSNSAVGSNRKTEQREPYQPKPQPKWSKPEIFFLLGLTAFVAILSVVYLGDFTAPQTVADASTSSISQTVVLEGEATTLWVYPGVISSEESLLVTTTDGAVVLQTTLQSGNLFQWHSYEIVPYEEYIVTIAGGQMLEIGFFDASGNLLSLSLPETEGDTRGVAMFDEQDLIPEQSSQLNGFYFDEIYHARTAYESIHGLQIYETTHPPMGKNFIALGVLLFGMTGFGWRIAGVVFGVLMVPTIYWMTRRLTRSALAAGFVALLLSFDFMRYAQSRIATIDTVSAFFILLAATCMVWYCQSVLEKGVRSSILPMALAGLAFGVGAASKWTGLYAGVGLAILYFGVLFARYQQQKILLQATDALPEDGTKRGIFSSPHWAPFRKECGFAVAGGFLFFVFLPLLIYIASYLPYRLADASYGLSDIWANQTYMYWYHANLDATHPFSSSWYSWFLDLRPVWYYMGKGLEEGTYASIAGFYNPILCWVGIVAWLRLALRALNGKGSFVGNTLLVLFLSQFLPWLLITRCTFLYHYFPSFLFTVVAIGLWFKDLLQENEARAYTLASALLTLAIFFFIWFFPVLSGLPVDTLWAQTLKILPSYGFYIIS